MTIHIHKGFPNAGLDADGTPLDLNALLVQSKVSTFLFTIDTDQFEHLGIFKGDIAIVDKARTPKKGALIAAVTEGEFTLEYFSDQRQAWGVVTSVIHRY
jgi:DNA polymerase V